MALYFECRINKNALLQFVFFGDFAYCADDYFSFGLNFFQSHSNIARVAFWGKRHNVC